MWTPIINILVCTIIPGILAGLSGIIIVLVIALARKGYKYLVKKWDLDISEREQYALDLAIDKAVRATEEQAKGQSISSVDKEELAIAKVKEQIGNKVSDSGIRTSIKAAVNSIFHR